MAHRLLHEEPNAQVPSTNWVAFAFLDEIIDRFQVFVDQIVLEVTTLDDLVLTLNRREQTDLLRRIALARRRLATLRSTLWAKKELLDQVSVAVRQRAASILAHVCSQLKKNERLMTESVGAYMRDVMDDVSSMLERMNVSAEVLNHLDNTYLTRLSLEVAQSGEVMNDTMKKFSAVATIFLPLSTVAGIFGMNVQVPGQVRSNARAQCLIERSQRCAPNVELGQQQLVHLDLRRHGARGDSAAHLFQEEGLAGLRLARRLKLETTASPQWQPTLVVVVGQVERSGDQRLVGVGVGVVVVVVRVAARRVVGRRERGVGTPANRAAQQRAGRRQVHHNAARCERERVRVRRAGPARDEHGAKARE